MSKCGGLHCPGCGDGGGGLVLMLIVLAVIAAAAWHVRHGIETAFEIVMWSILGGAGLVAAGGLVYAGLRIRASVRARRPRTVIPARAEIVRLGADASRPAARDTSPDVGRDAPRSTTVERGGSPAIEAPRAASWPLPGQWDEIRPRIGRDS